MRLLEPVKREGALRPLRVDETQPQAGKVGFGRAQLRPLIHNSDGGSYAPPA